MCGRELAEGQPLSYNAEQATMLNEWAEPIICVSLSCIGFGNLSLWWAWNGDQSTIETCEINIESFTGERCPRQVGRGIARAAAAAVSRTIGDRHAA